MLFALAFGIAGIAFVALVYVGFFQDRSRGRPRCPKCWYNMTGAPSLTCPECGHDARQERQLYRTRRRRWAIGSALAVAIASGYLWAVCTRIIEGHEPIVIAIRPTSYLLLKLPGGSQAEQNALGDRFLRSKVWPWEASLLLLQFNRRLQASPSSASPNAAPSTGYWPPSTWYWPFIGLMASAAKDSRRILDRLVELREHRDQQVREYLSWSVTSKYAKRLRDDQLSAMLDAALRGGQTYNSLADTFLAEMLRRNGPAFREQIARWAAHPPMVDLGAKDTPFNLELVAALRRIDHQPDPLRISVGPQVIECAAAALPNVHVTVRNVDATGVALGFQWGGDNRGPRQERWRFEVRDATGSLLPIQTVSHNFGGIFSFGPLKQGEEYETDLDMNKYVLPLPPGRYHAVVQYHNSHQIAYDEDVTDRIVFTSEPFELIVHGK